MSWIFFNQLPLIYNVGKASAQVVPDPYPTLTTGDVLSLTCQVNEDTINVTWKKDGDSLLERAKIYTQLSKKESKLTITEVLEEDGGKYSCEGRNKLGFVARSFVNITVKGKPALLLCLRKHTKLQ